MRTSIRIGLGAIVAIGLAACSETPPAETPTAERVEVSVPPAQASSPRNLVEAKTLASGFISEPVTYHIFLPPSYAEAPDQSYPVIYWLHGTGGYPPGMLQGLSARFNGAMAQNKIPEAIVVFPDGFERSMWTNSKDGQLPMEDIIIKELIPHIETEYRAIPDRSARLIEGGSMGGYGAARLGFKYSDMFAGISMLNPGPMQQVMNVEEAPIVGREGAQRVFDAVYGGDQAYFMAQSPWQLAIDHQDEITAGDLKIRMILGSDDLITPVNQTFSEHLEALSLEHELILLADAGHNPRQMFAALGEDYWTFFELVGEQ